MKTELIKLIAQLNNKPKWTDNDADLFIALTTTLRNLKHHNLVIQEIML